MNETREVVVVGGGVAGLACATRLLEHEVDVVLLEREEAPGGNVRTTVEDGFRLERGPHTFLGSSDAVFELVDSLDLGGAVTNPCPEAKARFIALGGRLHAAPTGPLSFMTSSLLSTRSKLSLATEPFRRGRGSPDDTAEVFFERRFGEEAARVLAGAFISGVYAGDPGQLSAAAAFPLFWSFEQETGSMIRGALRHRRQRRRDLENLGKTPRQGLFSFGDGLGQLTDALADALGDRCYLGAGVSSIVASAGGYTVRAVDSSLEARSVVIAAPPQAAAQTLETVDTAVADLLHGVPMAPVAVVHLGYDQRLAQVPDGFGFLAPRGEGIRTLGVLFPSRLFEGRAPSEGDLLTGFLGGMTDRKALELVDDELVGIMRDDLEALTGLEASPSFTRVRRYPRAIPQLVLGHLERLSTISTLLEGHEGLFLAGNYLKGVGMKDAAASGLDAAASVLNYMGR